jgi:hypothetical protein
MSYSRVIVFAVRPVIRKQICQMVKDDIPDREITPPLHKLLQRFHGTKFMTSLDLSKAFLQLPLKKSSRTYTTFCSTQPYTSIRERLMVFGIPCLIL